MKATRILLNVITLLSSIPSLCSHVEQVYDQIQNKRYDVMTSAVVTNSSPIQCVTACQQTVWCACANLAPDDDDNDSRECQLLSVVSTVTMLEDAAGWIHFRAGKLHVMCCLRYYRK